MADRMESLYKQRVEIIHKNKSDPQKQQSSIKLNKNDKVFSQNKAVFIEKGANLSPIKEKPNPAIQKQHILEEIQKLLSKGIAVEYIEELETLKGNQSLLENLDSVVYDQKNNSKYATNFLYNSTINKKDIETIAFLKQLFGESHVECRDLMNKLQMEIAQKRISVTKEEVIKLSKRPKDVPLLDKTKHKIDPKLQLESVLNPVHVKTKPLDLPKTVISHLKRHITPESTL